MPEFSGEKVRSAFEIEFCDKQGSVTDTMPKRLRSQRDSLFLKDLRHFIHFILFITSRAMPSMRAYE